MSFTIRDADARDAELLASLNDVVQRLHVAAMPAYFKQPELGAVAGLFRAKLERADVRIWIAHVDQRPVGYVVAIFCERPEHLLCFARSVCVIDEIGVVPAHRRRGLARALIERALAEARARGVRDVELNSWSFSEEAQTAFGALGFRPKFVRFGRES